MIKIENLTKIYKSKNKIEVKALDDICFDLPDKGLVYIIGKSGSGKSTLLNMLGGLDSITSGSINVHGLELFSANENNLYSYRSNNVGFIFQDFHLLDDLTVEENIRFSLKLLNIEDEQLITDALKEVDLEGYGQRYPKELSGGEKQRVAIARALVKNPEIILADEPTGNLDSKTTKKITELIKKISGDKLVVIVSHNLYDAYEYADRIIELSHGRLINDISRNSEYSDEITIKDDTLFLPLLKKFDEEELKNIYDSVATNKVKDIQQKEDKFINTETTISSDKELKKVDKNLKIKDTLQFSYLFGKTRVVRFLLSAFLTAIMTVVLFLGQSISFFKPSSVINDLIAENEGDLAFGIKKTLHTGQSAVKHISDDDIEKIKQYGYDGDVHELYNITLPLCFYFTLSEGTYPTGKIYSEFPNETTGVLVTNEEYVKYILDLDEIEIYTNNTPYNPGGFYITDYVADGILRAKELSTFYSHINTYDDILGEIRKSGDQSTIIDGYINGIIMTGYKEKYGDVMDKIKHTTAILGDLEPEEDIIHYYDVVANSYALQFSFEEDFIDHYLSDKSARNYTYFYSAAINDTTVIKGITTHQPSSIYGIEPGENEIAMSLSLYNVLFGTGFTIDTINDFVPHTAKLTVNVSADYSKPLEKEVIISKLIPNYNTFFVSEDIFLDIRKEAICRYALYFDGDYSMVIDNLDTNTYAIMSNKITSVQTMTKAVEVFNDFFALITTLLISAIMFLLISFGIKNVNDKIYEIGVMKALGCKQSRFSLIFGLHTLFIAVLVFVMSVIGIWLTYDFANTILVESINVLAPSYQMLYLQFIRFNWTYILQDSIVVFIVTIISTLVAILRLNAIKPIMIIKAKE